MAQAQMTERGRKNFLIPLLYEEVNVGNLDADLKMYIETHTYIDTINSVSFIALQLVFYHIFSLFIPQLLQNKGLVHLD